MTVVDTVSGTADAFLTTLNTYAGTHHDGIIALLVFTGVIVAFSGRTLLKPTVFLLGFVPATATIAALSLAFIADQKLTSNKSLFEALVVIASILVGVLVGIIMLRLLFRIATFVLCAGFGAVLVLVTHLFLFESTGIGPNALFILYSAVIFAALVAGLFSVSYPETGIILGTSFDGAALSVFSLARFLGHRPHPFSPAPADIPTSAWWSIGYGTATLILGIFGAMTQRQVAIADELIAKQSETSRVGEQLPTYMLPSEEDPLIGYPADPPKTPPFMTSGAQSPAGTSGYGAIEHEDSTYSVVHNLGAAPLEPSNGERYQKKEGVNGPL